MKNASQQHYLTFIPLKIIHATRLVILFLPKNTCILWTTLTTNRYEQTKITCYLIEHYQFWVPQPSAMHHSNSSPKKFKGKNQFKLKLKYHLVHPNFKILLQNKFYMQEINHHSMTRQGEWSCVISSREMLLKFPHPLYKHKGLLTPSKNLSTFRSINIYYHGSHRGEESNYYCPSLLSVTAVHCLFFILTRLAVTVLWHLSS